MTVPPAPLQLKWNLGEVDWSAAREREIQRHCFVEMRTLWEQCNHRGVRLTSYQLGQLAVNETTADAVRLDRTTEMIAREQHPVMFLNLVLEGYFRVEQGGRCQVAHPGSLMMFDGQQPFVLHAGSGHRLISLRVPHHELGAASRFLAAYSAAPVDSFSPWLCRGLKALLQEFAGQQQGPNLHVGAEIGGALVRLLRAMPEGNGPTTHQIGGLAAVRAYIAEHHVDPMLRPVDVANGLGLSLRRLHALAAAEGVSCMDLVYSCRLERARALLLASSGADLSMKDIAAAAGFTSPAHFSRRFTQRFGYPPRALRALR
ncbi:helix-turn-helix domain-containing protein [Variovorax sp. LT1R16]|uniref:helix-turn-helix domain-containing protein n=1 Tax=Variovorax sp. LT1R16 TaxID=3443728 RepID=UPI003F4483F3